MHVRYVAGPVHRSIGLRRASGLRRAIGLKLLFGYVRRRSSRSWIRRTLYGLFYCLEAVRSLDVKTVKCNSICWKRPFLDYFFYVRFLLLPVDTPRCTAHEIRPFSEELKLCLPLLSFYSVEPICTKFRAKWAQRCSWSQAICVVAKGHEIGITMCFAMF